MVIPSKEAREEMTTQDRTLFIALGDATRCALGGLSVTRGKKTDPEDAEQVSGSELPRAGGTKRAGSGKHGSPLHPEGEAKGLGRASEQGEPHRPPLMLKALSAMRNPLDSKRRFRSR
jgi:hypothetical protein